MAYNRVEQIVINCTYYSWDDLINKNNLDLKNFLVCKVSYEDLPIFYQIQYSTKDFYINSWVYLMGILNITMEVNINQFLLIKKIKIC